MNKIKLATSRAILAVALLFVAVPAATGCAAIMSAIPKIVSVITDAQSVLAIIDGAANEFFRTHPDIPPETRAKYVELHAKTLKALNAANHTLRGVQDLDQDQADAAFAEFRAAYVELRSFLESSGLMSGGKMQAGPGASPVEIPEPDALTFKLDD